MALYLVGRQLEIAQGWLYNYFIFLHDDILVETGDILNFLSDLRSWQPAVGLPASTGSNHGGSVASVNRANLPFVAYHREALEVTADIAYYSETQILPYHTET